MNLAERTRTRLTPAGIGAIRRQPWMQEFQFERPVYGHRCPKPEVEEVETVAAPVDSKDLFREASSLPSSDDVQVNFGRLIQHGRNKLALYTQGSLILGTPVKPVSSEKVTLPDIEKLRQSLEEILRVLGMPTAPVPSRADVSEVLSILKKAIGTIESGKSPTVEPRTVLESFDGYVDSIYGDTAYVTLESRSNGEVLYGEYSAQELLSKGIHEQTRFLCETVKGGGAGRVHFAPLPKNKVTDEEALAIAKEMREAFPGDDDSVIEY